MIRRRVLVDGMRGTGEEWEKTVTVTLRFQPCGPGAGVLVQPGYCLG